MASQAPASTRPASGSAVTQQPHSCAHELHIDRISKRYAGTTAVHEVSIDAPRGEFLTILGPSGSGKTTLLSMVAGFTQPSAGDIRVDTRSIVALPPERRNFGMVFQGYALFPHMSVRDNIAFPLRVRGIKGSDAERRVRESLELVRLGHLAERLPRQLSGGQQQRVALARALVFEPDVVLLDEPLGALDRKLRTEVQLELKALHQRLGSTFLFVTHDQEEALSMSDRIAIMRDGRLVQIGTPEELYERPRSRFVASFLGESLFIDAQVEGGDGGHSVYRVGGARFAHRGTLGRAGERALLALRPEKLELSERDPGAGVNRTAGEVLHWNYLGSAFHVVARTEALGTVASRLGEVLRVLTLLPMIVPPIVSALVFYRMWIDLDLLDTYLGTTLAHAILAVPYVVVTVSASLANVGIKLEQAARNLGADLSQTLRWVILPSIRPGIFAGALFAFITSWDELVVTLFITSRAIFTLPRRMWDGIREDVDPVIAAVSATLVLLTCIGIALHLLRGKRRVPR